MKLKRSVVLFVGFVGALALLGGVAWFGGHHTVRMQAAAELVSHAERVSDELNRLLLLTVEIEAGLRGYVLTGDPAFLAAYEDDRKSVTEIQRWLEQQISDAGQKTNLATLERLLAEQIGFGQVIVETRKNSGFEAARQKVASGKARARMNDVRRGITRLTVRQETLLTERAATSRRESETARRLTLTGTGLSFALLITVFALDRRENWLRQRAEAALRQSAAQLRDLFDGTSDIIQSVAPDGRILFVNHAWHKILGYSADELATLNIFEVIHADCREHCGTYFQRLMAGEDVGLMEVTFRAKDGHAVAVEGRVNVHFENGQPVATRGIFRNVTEHKRIEQTLLDFKAALDAHSIVAITDPRGKITYVNDKFCAMSKYPREELLGQDHRLINSGHHPKAFIRELWETITSGRVWKGELKNRAKDGTFYWVDTSIIPFLDADRKPSQYIAIRTDITERKQAEERIAQLNAELRLRATQLEVVNKELESFSYSVSHDLRAPLRHVHGYVEMLTTATAGQLSDTARRYLKTITDASGEMGQLIDDLLAFSRMSRTEMNETCVPMDGLAQDAIRGLEMATRDRNIAWKIAPLPPVLGDRSLLKQVLVNLVGNAVKYSRERDPAEIAIGCAGEEDGRVIFLCATTARVLICNMRTSSLGCSSGCTGPRSLKARASVWRPCAGSLPGTAGAPGPRANWAKARRFISRSNPWPKFNRRERRELKGKPVTDIKKLSDQVRQTAYDIHVYHGHGHLEKVYENALAHRLRQSGLEVQQQPPIKVYDEDGTLIGDYLADLLVENVLIVELKTAKALAPEHEAQILGYLKSARREHGLLINFGAYKFEIRKFVWSENSQRQPSGMVATLLSAFFAFFAVNSQLPTP